MLVATVGMVVVDRIAAELPDEPQSGKVQFTDLPIEEHVGGHPANVAIDLVKLGVPPEKVGVISAIGDDSAGMFIEKTISDKNIRSFLDVVEVPTGQNLILVPKGKDRCFNISPGANQKLELKYVLEILERERPRIISIRPGYSGIDKSVAPIAMAQKNSFILLDLMKQRSGNWDHIIEALPYVGAIHGNGNEIEQLLLHARGKDIRDKMSELNINCLLITHGQHGSEIITMHKRVSQPVFNVSAIDPTGCGDAYCAGIIKKIIEWEAYHGIEDLSLGQCKEMIRYAGACGAACATGIGTTAGVSEENVQKILERVR